MSEVRLQIGATEALPEEVGYDSSRIDALNQHLQKLVDTNILIGSSYSIARKGKIIACNSLGYNHYKKKETQLMQPDTVMGIASVTKLFTTCAIFQLVEGGFIRLDEPMSKYLPEFNKKDYAYITIAHMLSHSSGLWPDGGCFPDEKNIWQTISQLKANDNWLDAATDLKPRRKPGEEWMYSSFGFIVLGALIGKITNQKPEEYIMEHIVAPLGMGETAFTNSPARENSLSMTKKYLILDKEREKIIAQSIQELESTEKTKHRRSIWDSIPQTGGGLASNVIDLIKFANALCYGGRYKGQRILGRMSVEKMSEQYLHNVPDYCWGANSPNRLYGLGPDLRRGAAIITSDKFFFHEGSGALCLAVDPKEELAATWFVPYCSQKGWHPEALLNVKNIIWSGIM